MELSSHFYLMRAFSEVLEHNRVLAVVAKGLGIRLLFVKLLRLCCTKPEGNSTAASKKRCFFVLNASSEATGFQDELLRDGMAQVELPVVITSKVTSSARLKLYDEGGCFIVTSRILVVDLLTKLLDPQRMSGVLVYNAHLVTEGSTAAFALRIFQETNTNGFIRAVSSSPQSLASGFGKLRQVMTSLGVEKLCIWPRFHVEIQKSLESSQPEVIELAQSMTNLALGIQRSVVGLIELNLKELQRSANVDISDLTTDVISFGAIDSLLRKRLDKEWHTVSIKTKNLISDIGILRKLLFDLLKYDSTTLHLVVEAMKQEATRYSAVPKSMWMLTDGAAALFKNIKKRAYSVVALKSKDIKRLGSILWALGKDGKRYKLHMRQEENPKWGLLRDLLKEVQEHQKQEKTSPLFGAETVVYCKDSATCVELRNYLKDPKHLQKKRFDRYLSKVFKRHRSTLMNAVRSMDGISKEKSASLRKETEQNNVQQQKRARHAYLSKKDDTVMEPDNYGSVAAMLMDGDKVNHLCQLLQQNMSSVSMLTVEQRLLLLQYLKQRPTGDVVDLSDDVLVEEETYRLVKRCRFLLHPEDQSGKHGNVLERNRPRYVIIYDPSVLAVRECETYKARHPNQALRVYFLLYKGSVEEHRYLVELKRERESFQTLIDEKAGLVLTLGNSDGNATAVEKHLKAQSETIVGYNLSTGQPLKASARGTRSKLSTSISTNAVVNKRGGNGLEVSRVIVDMREFRSALPSILHKNGVHVEPVTLEVADYVLAPEIGVERKSIPDLFGSFNSGRLYKQAESLTRYYKIPCLLIEFDGDKPFSLQAVANLSDEITSGNIVSKLVLLTLHFPDLRLVWSPNESATVQLFKLLKANYSNPSSEVAAKVGVPDDADSSETSAPEGVSDNNTSMELLRSLPGVNVHNIPKIRKRVKSLKQLFNLSRSEMEELLGETNGSKLYKFISQTPVDS